MSQLSATQPVARMSGDRARRWCFAGVGVMCVGAGGVGVFVPGLPTTIFLIIASWCFTRSCPWLEQKLIHQPIFRPFLAYLEPGATMPTQARVISTLIMWIAIACSSLLVGSAVLASVLGIAGVAGTWCIWRFRRG